MQLDNKQIIHSKLLLVIHSFSIKIERRRGYCLRQGRLFLLSSQGILHLGCRREEKCSVHRMGLSCLVTLLLRGKLSSLLTLILIQIILMGIISLYMV